MVVPFERMLVSPVVRADAVPAGPMSLRYLLLRVHVSRFRRCQSVPNNTQSVECIFSPSHLERRLGERASLRNSGVVQLGVGQLGVVPLGGPLGGLPSVGQLGGLLGGPHESTLSVDRTKNRERDSVRGIGL